MAQRTMGHRAPAPPRGPATPMPPPDGRPVVAATSPIVEGAAAMLCAAIAVAALSYGRDVLVPLVLGVLLAFVLAPLVRLLQRSRIGRGPSVAAAVLLALAVLAALGTTIGAQLAELAGGLPRYVAALDAKLAGFPVLRGALRDAVSEVPGLGPGGPASNAQVVMTAQNVLGSALSPLATAGLVILFAILMLIFREDLRDRFISLAGARDLQRTMTAMNDAADRLSRLFLAQLTLNAGYAVVIAAALFALGLPSPLLWGLVAGLMRFVPFIGTPIAIAAPLILAVAAEPGWTLAIAVIATFLLGGTIMGQVLEPLLFGRRTGISPVSVVLSASFWAFLWGPVGLIIATPLTVGLVVLGRHVPSFAFLDVLLGDRPPLKPDETFYRRALDGDADGLVDQAREALSEPGGSLAAYADGIALGGLVLAQSDWLRETLEPERLETIRAQVTAALDDLSHDAVPEEDRPAGPWSAPGAVLVAAGRGRLDDLAAEVAALSFAAAGFGATAEGGAALEPANLARMDRAAIRCCVLSVLEEGNSVTGVRTLLRRIARAMPGTHVVVGLWRAAPDSPMLAALRAEGLPEAIVTSVREAIASCEALAARETAATEAADAA